MSTIPPMTGSGLLTWMGRLTPYTDIQPFTYRDGMTYQEILETMRDYLENTLVPYVNDGFAEINVTDIISNVLAAVANNDVAVVDADITAVLNQATSNAVAKINQIINTTHPALAVQDGIWAPPPIGGGADDTAALLAALTPIHQQGGTMYLRAGTYNCNLSLPAQFQQIQIYGQGMRATVLKAFDKTKPALKFNGGSGSVGGGGADHLSITSAATASQEGIALAFSGTTGVKVGPHVRISGSFAEGVRFWNERTGDFTEMNTFEGDISGCTQPVRYQVSNGVESFHGSGLIGNTSINITASTTEVIYVDKNGLPYNAPMSFNVWLKSGQDTRLFRLGAQGRPDNRHVSFHGSIRIEGHGASDNYELGAVDAPAKCIVLFAGEIMHFGTGTSMLGNIYLCDKIAYEGGTVWGRYKPHGHKSILKNTPTIIAGGFEGGQLCFAAVHIQAPNYEYHALWLVQRSQFDGTQAFMTELARTNFLDSGNKGVPSITFNSSLYASNPNFDSTFHANVTVTHLGGGSSNAFLPNRMYT